MLFQELFILNVGIFILKVIATENPIDQLLNLPKVISYPLCGLGLCPCPLGLLLVPEVVVSHVCPLARILKILFPPLCKFIVLFCGPSCQTLNSTDCTYALFLASDYSVSARRVFLSW